MDSLLPPQGVVPGRDGNAGEALLPDDGAPDFGVG
jgi:hypothetical protein